LWFHFEQLRADKKIEASIDKDEYNEAELVTIKVPLSLPYQNDTDEFERITGEINFKGKIYKYVKRKIENGNLVLLCLPDKNKMQIEKAKNDLLESSNDFTQTNSNKKENSKTISFKKATGDYDEYSFSFSINAFKIISQDFEFYRIDNLHFSPHISPEQPPDNFYS